MSVRIVSWRFLELWFCVRTGSVATLHCGGLWSLWALAVCNLPLPRAWLIVAPNLVALSNNLSMCGTVMLTKILDPRTWHFTLRTARRYNCPCWDPTPLMECIWPLRTLPIVGYPAKFGSTASSKQTNKQILPASQAYPSNRKLFKTNGN